MQVRWKGAVLSAVVAGGLLGYAVIPQQANASPQHMRFDDLTKTQKRLMSGFASAEVDQARGALAKKAPVAPQRYSGKAGGSSGNFYFPSGSRGCSYTLGHNVNMDTDCQNVVRPRPRRSRPGAERDLHLRGPLPPGQPRRQQQRLPPR